MNVSIRTLEEADLPAYKALRDEALRCAPDAFTSSYETDVHKPASSYASRLGAVDSGHFTLGALVAKGQLLGAISLEREARPKNRHSARVIGMMVAPAVQGHGIATKLVAVCASKSLAHTDLEQLTLTVTASNTHVVRLYERAGFKAYGLLPRAIKVGSQYFDKLHMMFELKR